MQERMKNPAVIIPEAMPAIQALTVATRKGEAARHYDEQGLAALLLSIATANVYNRLNLPTRQVAGAWG